MWKKPLVLPSCHNLGETGSLSLVTVLTIMRGTEEDTCKACGSGKLGGKVFRAHLKLHEVLAIFSWTGKPFPSIRPQRKRVGDVWDTKPHRSGCRQGLRLCLCIRHRPRCVSAAQAGIKGQHRCNFPTTLGGTCKMYGDPELPWASQSLVTSFFGCPPHAHTLADCVLQGRK